MFDTWKFYRPTAQLEVRNTFALGIQKCTGSEIGQLDTYLKAFYTSGVGAGDV